MEQILTKKPRLLFWGRLMKSKLRELFHIGKSGELERRPEEPVKNPLYGMMCLRLTRMVIGRRRKITMAQAVEIRERRKGKYGVK